LGDKHLTGKCSYKENRSHSFTGVGPGGRTPCEDEIGIVLVMGGI